jgi:hypothetical protein
VASWRRKGMKMCLECQGKREEGTKHALTQGEKKENQLEASFFLFVFIEIQTR